MACFQDILKTKLNPFCNQTVQFFSKQEMMQKSHDTPQAAHNVSSQKSGTS
jgi:hypothetical protein